VSIVGLGSFAGVSYGVAIAHVTYTVWLLPRERGVAIADDASATSPPARSVVYLLEHYQGIARLDLLTCSKHPGPATAADVDVEVRSLGDYGVVGNA
jgi:hypothetical protein